MLLNILLILIGVVLVLWGADRLTDGASAIARRMEIPEIVIGLTIVAAGTSAPELFVSVTSALSVTPEHPDLADLAVGNVVGSNIMNALLIVGVTAMVAPMSISRSTVVKDIPFTLLATLLLMLLCLDAFGSLSLNGNTISRIDGILLLMGFTAFMLYTLRMAKKDKVRFESGQNQPLWKSLLFVVLGLGCLIGGSNLFVNAASAVATYLGVSQSIIGLTIVAGGTSLPELATSVVAARKGRSAMAIGNVLGSNVFNILLILGLTATISPMQITGITMVDLTIMLLSMLLIWLFSYTKYTMARWEGAVLTLIYMAYASWLLYNI